MLGPSAKLHENSDLLSLEREQNWTKLMLEKSPGIPIGRWLWERSQIPWKYKGGTS